MHDIPFEDQHWERLREEYENPPRAHEYELRPQMGWLFLDDLEDDIEAQYGCPISQLFEGDLFDILDRYADEEKQWISATWNQRKCGIQYLYRDRSY